jgi:type IV secretory pathway VirB6-like protein
MMMQQKNDSAKASGKGAVMQSMMRTMRLAVLALVLAAGAILPTQALASATYGEPPNPLRDQEVTASMSLTDKYAYDLYTSMQVAYWGRVVDSIGTKFSSHVSDLAELDSADKIWDLIEEHEIDITEREAQVLCLFMRVGEEQPDEEIVPEWPEDGWPNCGGVLETMFGEGFIGHLNENRYNQDMVDVYISLLAQMGISGANIKDTINVRVSASWLPGAGEDDISMESDTAGGEYPCYTPANNIKLYDGCGVLCTVTRVVMGLLNTASEGLVQATADNPKFQQAILAALTLYVTIYGAMVVLGLVQVALGDAVMRVIKLGVVAMLISSSTVMTLFHMARCFFIEGTTYLVNGVLEVGVQAVASIGADVNIENVYQGTSGGNNLCSASFDNTESAQGPLVILESLLAQVFSPHMGLNILTLFFSKIEGALLTVMLLAGLFGFLMSILGAVTIYITSLIGQYLLLSLMPFFIVFLLFEKTNHLFEGWLKQLITYSLMPIFLFAYISLFVVVISAALAQILDVKICYAPWFSIPWVFDLHMWQYYAWDGNHVMNELPFGFFEVLIFFLLSYLLKEFEDTVEHIARDIGGAYIYVNKAATALQGWFKGKANQIKAMPVQAAKSAASTASKAAQGGMAGHRTNSASGQRGTGGAAGAAKNVASKAVPRKGPGG